MIVPLAFPQGESTYPLTVSCLCDGAACYPTVPGPPNILGVVQERNATVVTVSVASTTSYLSAEANRKWVLDGYVLDNDAPVNASSVSIIMFDPHTVTWNWHLEVLVTLTSNFGTPSLIGSGWYRARSTITVSAPQSFFSGDSQYLFQTWLVASGSATILNQTQLTTNVTLTSDPATLEAQYRLVAASNESTVQLLIRNGATPLYNANVTVKDDAGETVWKGFTDTSGLTSMFMLRNNLIYTIQIQHQSLSYTSKQKFPQSQTYTVDVSQGQPKITLSQIAPYVIPIIVVAILITAVAIYYRSRRAPERPKYEWVNR